MLDTVAAKISELHYFISENATFAQCQTCKSTLIKSRIREGSQIIYSEKKVIEYLCLANIALCVNDKS